LKEAGNDVSDRRGVSGEQAIGSLSKRYPVERGTDSGGADLFYPPRCRPDNEPDKDFNPMRIFARSLTTRKCRKVVQNGVIRADKTNWRLGDTSHRVKILILFIIGPTAGGVTDSGSISDRIGTLSGHSVSGLKSTIIFKMFHILKQPFTN